MPFPAIPSESLFQHDTQTAWCWQETLGLVKSLNDVFFLDTQTGWAVGQKGMILHTEDGGSTWQWQTCPVAGQRWIYPDLQRVAFVDAQTGWAVGSRDDGQAILLHTSNKGQAWEEQPLPVIDAGYQVEMSWANAQIGWLIVGHKVLHTTDGGQAWQEYELPDGVSGNRVVSVDGRHTWISTRSAMLHTADGGETWVQHPYEFGVAAFTFVDNLDGWLVQGDSVLHTADGGQTWEVQLEQPGVTMRDVAFYDVRTGWAVGERRDPQSGDLIGTDGLWYTRDGGETWKLVKMPPDRRAIFFADDRHGWIVGGLDWRTGRRVTIIHTQDGGATWQTQDAYIETPAWLSADVSHLNFYWQQKDPPVDALVARLFPSSCACGPTEVAFHNLGWNGESWDKAPAAADKYTYDFMQRMDVDLDQDSTPEVVLYGKSEISGLLFAGVLDWDGAQWQASWADCKGTFYSGQIRVRVESLGGRPTLLVEFLRHPYKGSGILSQAWDVAVVQCEHLDCFPLWTETLSRIDHSEGVEGSQYDQYGRSYAWSGSDCRFVGGGEETRPDIEWRRYGLALDDVWTSPSQHTLDVQVAPVERILLHWDGAQYTPTAQAELRGGYALSTSPVTKTMDLNSDKMPEQLAYHWSTDSQGLWETLAIYPHDGAGAMQPTQVFTVAIAGVPGEGFSLQDTDDDGRMEVMTCETAFTLTASMDGEWPSMGPVCTVHSWDHDLE